MIVETDQLFLTHTQHVLKIVVVGKLRVCSSASFGLQNTLPMSSLGIAYPLYPPTLFTWNLTGTAPLKSKMVQPGPPKRQVPCFLVQG